MMKDTMSIREGERGGRDGDAYEQMERRWERKNEREERSERAEEAACPALFLPSAPAFSFSSFSFFPLPRQPALGPTHCPCPACPPIFPAFSLEQARQPLPLREGGSGEGHAWQQARVGRQPFEMPGHACPGRGWMVVCLFLFSALPVFVFALKNAFSIRRHKCACKVCSALVQWEKDRFSWWWGESHHTTTRQAGVSSSFALPSHRS